MVIYRLKIPQLTIDKNGLLKAVQVSANQLAQRFKNDVTTYIYSRVHRRTGELGRDIKPFVLVNSNEISIGVQFNSPYESVHIRTTETESPYTIIAARGGKMLAIPLVNYAYRSRAGLDVFPTNDGMFVGTRNTEDTFTPYAVLKRSVKIPKKVDITGDSGIMRKWHSIVARELSRVAQRELNKMLGSK